LEEEEEERGDLLSQFDVMHWHTLGGIVENRKKRPCQANQS